MSMPYKVIKQSFGFDETKTEKYVAKAVTGGMLPFKKVCNQVSQICGAHRGTVVLVIGGLLDVMVNNLDMGHSVQLGEFGILRPGLRAKAQDTEEAANAQSIYRKKINFVPGKMLKDFLEDLSVTRTTVTASKSNSSNQDPGSDDGGEDWVDPTT
ncbi:DNA-binding protein [Bacteroides sp. 214]|uniref:HU family DNA-binding protein n=1 Tax=Bacteroides sp. 214 TaxID=2302935 RepID=UPI0013D5F8AD|nr:DNA-binding protein [Bacteroides sp. 214]NDW12383.1 DNA-binding protein [Bacteroides sp. 214]